MTNKSTHVLTQLMSIGGRLKIDKKSADQIRWICCPFHGGGQERTPSCKVNITASDSQPGSFYCFGCREHGAWNKLADALNLQGFKASDKINDIYAFSFIEDTGREQSRRLEEFKDLKRWSSKKVWRKIEPAIVRLYGGCLTESWYYRDKLGFELYFPVEVNKKYVGGVYAKREITDEDKEEGAIAYLNTPGQWTKDYLFGYNVAKLRPRLPLWLVEGPRDTMKTHQVGGRVVGCLGAYYSDRKKRLIEALDPPALILGFDPDAAGQKAAKQYKENITNIPLYEAQFPEGKDPGNFTRRSYEKIMTGLGLEKYLELET